MDLVQIGRLTEEQARRHIEHVRWPDGPVCPHCKSTEVTRLEGEKHRAGVIQCNSCREQFTATLGTVMEDTHIPLVKWLMAFHLMASSKKGISSLQLQRQLGLGSYRSAWHMTHRIRLAMAATGNLPSMEGEVEVDETYVGGKPPKRGFRPKFPRSKRGRGTRKAPVVALVERSTGKVRTKMLGRVSIKNLKTVIHQHVRKDATLHTDELAAYRKIGRGFADHQTVCHSEGEYARNGSHVNSCESFFALLKRGIHGSFHHVSKKHLHRYCDEFGFRWEHKNVTDGERTVAAIRKAEGKRLLYRTQL